VTKAGRSLLLLEDWAWGWDTGQEGRSLHALLGLFSFPTMWQAKLDPWPWLLYSLSYACSKEGSSHNDLQAVLPPTRGLTSSTQSPGCQLARLLLSCVTCPFCRWRFMAWVFLSLLMYQWTVFSIYWKKFNAVILIDKSLLYTCMHYNRQCLDILYKCGTIKSS
jgi:hypothetical protein